MRIRIEKIIAQHLNVSRNDAKKIIHQNRVLVNKKILKKPISIDLKKDVVEIDNEIVDYKANQYFIFNKPSGYVTANFDKLNQTIFEIIDLDPNSFFAYGRLDKDTEGLLIISNDGKLGHQIMNPKFEIAKKYYFEITTEFDQKIKNHFPKPILISNDYNVKKYHFEFLSNNSGYLTIYEGKFHQVKEMLKFFGYEIKYLKRIQIGKLKLDKKHEIGQLKEISLDELQLVFKR
ncbi:pseudouridine synthase [Metamycoplasma alkalescens]|uniref:pseudouridine synthase n=1 Tax=Metamycoplasma alkalescens TaxID=45363 RepID=UPI003D083003